MSSPAPKAHPEKFDASSNKAFTLLEAPTSPLILSPVKDLFTKFMKVFMEMAQAQAQTLAEPQKRPLKAKTSETYWGKSHMDFYYFCQQYEDHFKTSSATGINRTRFAAILFHDPINFR